MSEWQPIETAPRDGTLVLLFGIPYGTNQGCEEKWPISAVGRFYNGSPPTPRGREPLFWEVRPQDYDGIFIDATHWMPLPEPPHA